VDFPLFGRRLIVTIVTVGASCTSSTQGDTWWALRAGDEIVRRHSISLTDRYSYTAYGAPWPDHEWLWQAAIAVLHGIGGLPLVTLFVGLLAGAALAVSVSGRARRTDLAVLLLAIPGVMGAWAVRPQVLSMLLFAIMLWLLRTRRWWWAVPLMLLWANAHGGVVFGGVALGAGCVAALVERRHLAPLLAVTALGALATLCTPLGIGLWHYVLTSGSRPFEQRITEWQPPYRHLSIYTLVFWTWLAAICVLVLVRRRRLRTWPGKLGLATTLATLPLALDASRNMVMFVLAALPLAVHLLRNEDAPRRGDDGVPLARPTLAVAAALGALVTAAVYVADPPALGWQPMSRQIAAAIRACPGHVYTSYDSGAYLIWFTPSVPVFVDNRQDPYSERILDLSVLDEHSDYRPTFARYDVRCAALLTSGRSGASVLEHAGWRTAAKDPTWVVLTAPGTSLGSPS